MATMLQILDFLGVAVFAVTGAIVASRLRLDCLAFVFFAVFTGVGGGTLRDLLLDAPVFWVENEIYLVVCISIGALMWFATPLVERMSKPLRWADAMGLAAYSVMGAAKTLALGHPPTVAVLMGVATATFGGIIRDTIADQPSALVNPELYLTPAFVGAGVYVGLFTFGIEAWPAAIAGVAAALVLRGGAIIWGWNLPAYTPPSDTPSDKP
ncbi:trimeric intracellular cation channel family protein [Stappia sp. 28M-7]|uniref:trimeric intracellular cation channel family protein n=1 Tax=Stappia sp. 28M-7 TaxID=2762596 RepID=UPI000E75A7A8|nr:trimeric intracellular cation channel family protein [Stappia sp. 28M-7]MBC2857690.1 trimeric intracellular cation channel family protein [Stappia sp. 28M-7]